MTDKTMVKAICTAGSIFWSTVIYMFMGIEAALISITVFIAILGSAYLILRKLS